VNTLAYKNYGAKGVRCFWYSFEEFRDDMYESYLEHAKIHSEQNTTIERINVFGNYERGNCRWATWEEQSKNKRNSIAVSFNGEAKTIKEVADIMGVSYEGVYERHRRGGDVSFPYREHEHVLSFGGKEQTIVEWSKETGVPRSVIYARVYYHNWPVERALSTPHLPPRERRSSTNVLYTYDGKTMSSAQWAREVGLAPRTLWARLNKGYSLEWALNTPKMTHSESGKLAQKIKDELEKRQEV